MVNKKALLRPEAIKRAYLYITQKNTYTYKEYYYILFIYLIIYAINL